MIQRRRHASADELALLAVGELRRRKAVRIESHLTGCNQCTELRQQLGSVPVVLASATYPPIPESVCVRIETTLAVESRQRVAALPATEAGRGDLPARHRRRAERQGWRLAGLSIPATRLVATAAALAIVAGGSYEIAVNTGNGAPASRSAGSAAAPAQVQQMSQGPEITYGSATAQHRIQAVQSSANFVPASLSTQVTDAVHDARARAASAAQPTLSPPGASRAQNSASAGSSPGIAGRLSGCLNLVAAARKVLLVDIARFEHKPATLIVIAASGASPAEAWIVGFSCSATDRDILGHAVLGRL